VPLGRMALARGGRSPSDYAEPVRTRTSVLVAAAIVGLVGGGIFMTLAWVHTVTWALSGDSFRWSFVAGVVPYLLGCVACVAAAKVIARSGGRQAQAVSSPMDDHQPVQRTTAEP